MQLKQAVSGKSVEVSPSIFGKEYNEALIHQVVTAFLAGSRSGTRAQLSRGMVAGGGAKPKPQKGSGGARAGTPTSPIWRTGGVTFAAKPQDHTQKVNKKMYRGAICSILSELVRQERLVVSDEIAPSNPKTKEMITKLAEHGVENGALIIVKEWDTNLYLASRNIPKVDVVTVDKMNPVSLIKYDRVIATSAAVKGIQEVLA